MLYVFRKVLLANVSDRIRLAALAPTDEGERSQRFQVFIWVAFFRLHVVILIVVVAFGILWSVLLS